MSHQSPSNLVVQVHLGAEHTTFDAALSDSVATVKATALTNLTIVLDPAIDYFLAFEGETIDNETQTLEHLLGGHVRPHLNFHVIKRPKGGRPL